MLGPPRPRTSGLPRVEQGPSPAIYAARPLRAPPIAQQLDKCGGPGSHHMKLLFLRDFLVLSRCLFDGYQQKYQQRCQGEEDRSAAPMRSRQPRALVVYRGRSNYEGSLIASSRESVFEVGPARAGRLSVPRRTLAGRRKIGWRSDERSESLLC